MENTKVKLNRMRQQTPKQRHHASWRAGDSPPWPPLFFTHKTDVHTSWGLPGATVQRPTFPVSCGRLEEGASPPATMCNKPPQIQMTQECPGHRSTLQRKHPVHQQSAEPESPLPPPRSQDPEPQSWSALPGIRSNSSKGKTRPTPGPVPRAKSPFPKSSPLMVAEAGVWPWNTAQQRLSCEESASP